MEREDDVMAKMIDPIDLRLAKIDIAMHIDLHFAKTGSLSMNLPTIIAEMTLTPKQWILFVEHLGHFLDDVEKELEDNGRHS